MEAFHIARYPVTIAQFQAFVRACHDGEPLAPRRFCVIGGLPPPKHRAAYANHPADTVNWYDAMAFCEWLSECLGFEIRLPTEFEWQQAATGGDPQSPLSVGPRGLGSGARALARQHQRERARTQHGGRHVSAGASPVGALDMAGTLCEWCLNAFDDPDNRGLARERPGAPCGARRVVGPAIGPSRAARCASATSRTSASTASVSCVLCVPHRLNR